MTQRILQRGLWTLGLATVPLSALAERRSTEIEALNEIEALLSCNMLADQAGATGRRAVENVDYFRWSCTYDVPPRREISVEVMPLLHEAQARPVCRSAASNRNGRWTGEWVGNGALAAGRCIISVPAN